MACAIRCTLIIFDISMISRDWTSHMIHTESQRQKTPTAYEAVRTIGLGLDRQVFPKVADNGLVLPTQPVTVQLQLGKEKCDVEPKRGPATGSRQRAARRKGKAAGSWPSCPAPSNVRRSSAADYEEDLAKLKVAYPKSQVFVADDGIWLVAHSAVVEGLDREAVFIAAIPFDIRKTAHGWAFWSRGCLAFAQWIGPRHTNFPTGSICAFDPRDNAWNTGDSAILLLDLYSVWAVRHLHLEYFGRWPARRQRVGAYERRRECREDELCGCGSLDKTYAECCLPSDLQGNLLRDALLFLSETGGGERSPPAEILQFLREQSVPPPIARYS
jgi:hypothetical protein